MKNSIKLKQLIIIFFMGLAYTIVYALPFVQYVFYDDLQTVLNVSNAQLGTLITIFGIGNLLAPFGGALGDKFNTKKIYIVAMFIVSALNFLFVINMSSYTFALLVWGGFALAGLFLFFPAHTKLVRLLGSEEQQGTIFGLTESACGITSVIVNAIALYFYSKFAIGALGGVSGLKAVIISYGVIGIISTVVLMFLIPNDISEKEVISKEELETEKTKSKLTMEDWLNVLKDPRTWMSGFAVFSTYTMYVTLSYYTPYFTNVLGVTVVFSGGLAVLRTYGTRFIGSPIGGMIGDKIKSVSTVVGVSLLAAAIIIVGFMVAPAGTSQTLLVALTLIIGVFTYMARGGMFAVPSELKISRKYAASTAGVVCAVGYCPDLFIFILYGYWLDKFGNTGYTYIFIYAVVVLVLGFLNSLLIRGYKKKHLSNMQEIEG